MQSRVCVSRRSPMLVTLLRPTTWRDTGIARPIVVSAVVAAWVWAASASQATLLSFKRIECSSLDDRLYLQGGFFPEAGIADFTEDGRQWDWLKTLPAWGGAMIELPVIPQFDNTIRVDLTPHEACRFEFYVMGSGMTPEYCHRMAGTPFGPRVAEVEAEENRQITAEFVLSSELLQSREHVMLFYRPMAIDNSDQKADVEFRTHRAEVLVPQSQLTEILVRRYRQIEVQRLWKEQFTIVADSFVRPGEEFGVNVVAWTPAGYPDVDFTGSLQVISSSPNMKVPSDLRFTPEDEGVKRIEGLTCTQDGAYFVRAFPADTAHLSWRSNYIVCDSQSPYRLLWGDLHVHTAESDGSYSLDATYRFARDVSRLDFISINDHDVWRWPEKWEKQQAKAREYHEPGEFVVIPGVEWTSTYRGHRNVWFGSYDIPSFYGVDPVEFYSQPVSDLYAEVAPHGAILCTHHLHPKNDYSDWTVQREPAVEIYSVWGSSESAGRPEQTTILFGGQRTQSVEETNSAVNLLDRGFKVGFLANSDTHTSTPGANVPHNYRVGVTPYRRPGISAVFARERSREAVMEAIRDRRCYGTMNERIVIDFRVNGEMMGREINLEDSSARIRMRVWGTGNISALELIRNGEVIYSPPRYGQRDTVDVEFVDRHVPPGTSYYYLRVQQLMHGEYVNAWSSPVWVTRESANGE